MKEELKNKVKPMGLGLLGIRMYRQKVLKYVFQSRIYLVENPAFREAFSLFTRLCSFFIVDTRKFGKGLDVPKSIQILKLQDISKKR